MSAEDDVGIAQTPSGESRPTAESCGSAPEWLRRMAYTGSYPRPQINAPHSLEWRGMTYTVATNGHIMVAVPEDFGCSPFPDGFGQNALRVLDSDDGESTPLNLGALRAFITSVMPPEVPMCAACDGEGTIDCVECDGEGFSECECHCGHEHETDCDACSGTGSAKCTACNGEARNPFVCVRIDGKVFNARLFAEHLDAFAGDTARMMLRAPSAPTTIDCGKRRIVLMAMREDETLHIAGQFMSNTDASTRDPVSPSAGAQEPASDAPVNVTNGANA